MCLDILFNYKPVAMEKDGTALRNLVADSTTDTGSRGAGAPLDTGVDALCPSHMGSHAHSCIFSSSHASLSLPRSPMLLLV